MKQKYFLICYCLVALIFLPNPAKAATLYITPEAGSFNFGSTFTLTVRTDTEGQAVNAAEASLGFPTDILELVKVSASPTFYLQVPGSPAKGNGTVYFGGGLPTPGYKGGSRVLGILTFRAIRKGQAAVRITAGKVLLNDGNGTDALAGIGQAQVTIVP